MKFIIRHANDVAHQRHHAQHTPAKPLNPAVEALFRQVQADPQAAMSIGLGALLLVSAFMAVIRK